MRVGLDDSLTCRQSSCCVIYDSCWWFFGFSPVCLQGPVIHEWTRLTEPSIVEVHRERWIFRINFFRVIHLPPIVKSIAVLHPICYAFPISWFHTARPNYLSTAWLTVWALCILLSRRNDLDGTTEIVGTPMQTKSWMKTKIYFGA